MIMLGKIFFIGQSILSGVGALRSKGTIVDVGTTSFYVPSKAVGKLQTGCNDLDGLLTDENFIAATIINTSKELFNRTDLLQYPESGLALNDGPYLICRSTLAIHTPYRLYSDTQGAFVAGVVPTSNDAFMVMPVSIDSASSMSIGVPSRLYFTPTAELPLAGVRVGVKDIFNLKGVKTGAGSRAYYDLYDKVNTTASAVQRLVDAGAIVVGKMKTTQFAAPELARVAIDYQAPFNARGDGYQDPGSSSSGSGAGIGSYDWLDLALGSDTGGSVRVPAQNHGVFGNRPSHGHIALDGAVPLAPQYDTAGLLCRDPLLWRSAAEVLYSGLTKEYTVYPRHIQTFGLEPADSPDLNPAQKIMADWVAKVAEFLSAETTVLNYTERWAASCPTNSTDELEQYMGYSWAITSAREQTKLVHSSFFADYAAKYDGRVPFLNPSTRESWNWSDTIQLSESGSPTYRDSLAPFSGILSGLQNGLFISPFTEIPDFVVPIGEVYYNSTITMRQEVLPITFDILAARGCDMMLMDLINDLAKAGLLPKIHTGNSIQGGKTYI